MNSFKHYLTKFDVEMSYRNPNTSQNSDEFHGKESISETEYTGEQSDDKKDKKKDFKKSLFKKDSKDKGYSSLTGESNQDSIFLVNTKHKKPISLFKKSFKDEKRLKDIKETKEEFKKTKKLKDKSEVHENFFGNYIENVVKAFASNDLVKVPAPFRICLDIIETKGIESEHLYRRSVNKSQLESICDSINHDKIETRLDELYAEPNLCGAIIKKFLRELKAPLINDDMLTTLDKFDSGISDKDVETKSDFLKKLISTKLPQANYEILAYLTMHFHRILAKSDTNKIEIGVFVQKFQPIFRIREKLFRFMIQHAESLFSDFRFKRYRLKTNEEAVSRFSLLPDNIDDLEQEISKQEIYLAKLHTRIANEENSSDKSLQEQLSEELWALQRYVTSLKRKVKKLKLERKNLETEQINKMKELTQQNSTINVSNEKSVSNQQEAPATHTIDLDEQQQPQNQTSVEQLQANELNLICENNVLIETFQHLLEKSNREKATINELQQKITTLIGNANIPFSFQDNNMLSYQELYDNEQQLINENKLLEERINLINKRINNEKEKIFELKLSIQLKTLPNGLDLQTSLLNNMQLGGKINLPDKELIMTKL